MTTTIEVCRSLMAGRLLDSCQVLTVAETDNDYGSVDVSLVAGESYGCRMSPLMTRRSNLPTGLDPSARSVVALPWGAEVEAGNVILHGGVLYPVVETQTVWDGVLTFAYVGAGRDD